MSPTAAHATPGRLQDARRQNPQIAESGKLSDQLEGWLTSPGPKTLGGLSEVFQEKSFAVQFVLLLALPALPLPTGGVTHVFELVAMLLAVQLVAGRRTAWLPERWRQRELGAAMQQRFRETLLGRIRWLERHSRPRFTFLLTHRLSSVAFGAVVLAFSLTAFLAPPFTGLDTLPALGVVLLSVGVLLDDALLAVVGVIVGVIGIVLVLILGTAAYHGVSDLF
jgi:hypothetical protein